MHWITQTDRGAILSVHATPRACKSGLQGLHGDALKIRLQAPPVDGKANAALKAFLAEILSIPLRQISIVSGETGRQKRVRIEGLDQTTIAARLGIPIPPQDAQ